jgi:hypothetical protein
MMIQCLRWYNGNGGEMCRWCGGSLWAGGERWFLKCFHGVVWWLCGCVGGSTDGYVTVLR